MTSYGSSDSFGNAEDKNTYVPYYHAICTLSNGSEKQDARNGKIRDADFPFIATCLKVKKFFILISTFIDVVALIDMKHQIDMFYDKMTSNEKNFDSLRETF